MNVLWKVSGAVADVWGPRLRLATGLSHAVLAAAYLVFAVNLLKRYLRRDRDLLPPEAFRYLSVLLALSVLMNACDVVALYWPDPPLFLAVALVTAAFAAVAAYRLPRSVVRPVRPADACAAAERELGERHERLKARVVTLEDAFRRNTWIRQSREAMQYLNDMLVGFESLLVDSPADDTNPRRSAS